MLVFNRVALAAAAVVALSHETVAGDGQAPAPPLLDLLVPTDRLPSNCALAPRTISVDGTRVRTLWSFPVSQNPWRGTEPSVLAEIRTRMGGRSPMVPDGPPPTRRESRRYVLAMAEGIEEGFAAFYYAQGDEVVVPVYAVRARDLSTDWVAPGSNRFRVSTLGDVVVGVVGDNACADAVQRHIDSLAR